jgi:peptidyl-tRNA hydrolase, PTH1 family
MQLIVGLGNPGGGYEGTRHNVGFSVLDRLAKKYNFKSNIVVHGCATAYGKIADIDTILIKPLLYMNRSGHVFRQWATKEGHFVFDDDITFDNLLVIYDDIALPLGSLRVRPSGSDGGHRGVENLINALRTKEFPRMRLGVAGEDGEISPSRWSDYVLEKFRDDEKLDVDSMESYAIEAVEYFVENGRQKCAAKFNRRIKRSPENNG